MPPPEQSKLKEKVRQLPNRPGVYLMKDRIGSVIYVGKAKNLKKRVGTYFQPSRKHAKHPKIRSLISMIHDFDTLQVKSETEALLLESKLIRQWKPKYNSAFMDDKRFLMIRLDERARFPQFQMVRNQRDDAARYFGPFAYSGMLRKTLAEMRLKFGILLNDTTPRKQGDGVYRLYDDVRGEIYGHSNYVTPEDFRKRVGKACAFLEGKTREWLAELKNDMHRAAKAQKFERAAELRDVVAALENTIARDRRFKRAPTLVSDRRHGLKQLKEIMNLPDLPRHMECFDISHISGTFVVASMVYFKDGKPNSPHYRRFKIRSFIGNDDFKAMEEVVGRRYRRLRKEKKPFPDLVVIDGRHGTGWRCHQSLLRARSGAATPHWAGQEERNHNLRRWQAPNESDASVPRLEDAATHPGRSPPIRQHFQRPIAFKENPRIHIAGPPRIGGSAPGFTDESFPLSGPPEAGQLGGNPIRPRIRPQTFPPTPELPQATAP